LVKFGIKTGPGGYSFQDLKSIWLEAEKLGFDSGWLYDHLYSLNRKEEICLECWTTLTALAASTRRLKIGTMVLCNQFRHPSLLAKMAATLDVISEGRLQLGIGAGWYEEESRECGIDFPEAKTRILRLRESVQIIRMLWTSEKASFSGEYYAIKDAVCNPKPIQKPHPPIWIGIIKGKKLMPKVVAEVADGVNLTFLSPQECRQRIDILKAACLKRNRSPDELQLSWQGRILIAPDQQQLKGKIESFAQKSGMDVASFLKDQESEATIIGTAEECLKKLQTYLDLGIGYFLLLFLGDRTLEPIRLFAEHVMPKLQ